MDALVEAALKKWPNVPHCHGWLALDARGLDALRLQAKQNPEQAIKGVSQQFEAVFLQTKRIAAAYMPYKYRAHRYITDITRREVVGYRRAPFWQNWWEYVDIDSN